MEVEGDVTMNAKGNQAQSCSWDMQGGSSAAGEVSFSRAC